MSRRALPFDVIVADPPWKYGDKLPGKTRGAERNYETMTIKDLCRYFTVDKPTLNVSESSAVLFLWKVAAIPEWQYVCDAWGFKPVSELVWVKTTGKLFQEPGPNCVTVEDGNALMQARLAFGMGRKVRNCHEVCVIAQRGKPMEPADKSIRSVFFAPVREHSRKPDEFYRIVERMYPQANRLELFSREDRKGWTCEGNEKGKFG